MNKLTGIMYFLVGVTLTLVIGSSIGLIVMEAKESMAPMSCTDARAETMAMRACLRHRPQCLIQSGPAAFKLYHEALEVDDRCKTEGEQ